MPTVAGGGLVAVAAAIAVCVAALSGASGGASDQSAGRTSAASAGRAARSATPADPASPASLASTASTPSGTGKPHGRASGLKGGNPTRLVVPDVIASVPGGVTRADLARLRKIDGVRAVLAIDGARITVNGKQLTVLAAPEAAFRPWTPPTTASSAQVWSAFRAGQLITTKKAAAGAKLVNGSDYPVSAATSTRITEGGTALLGVAGVDGVVNAAEGSKLGLVRNVAVLVNAPAADVTTLAGQVRAALGASAKVVRLVPVRVSTQLPVDSTPPTGRPTSYLQLFQESAAQYCPGLSWTVLAAIGQIESADGQNMGPSTAGALGPMQFLPSTWKIWGITGFGDTGKPDIMNPFDAVPSAARLLCADGAATGGDGLRRAIFGYNHANWYVDEVLTLAAEYAREFG
ncbi:lytic transglycosylase domain-containing protein [Trebonia kvetii]|uniref:lytic transglycosylase domain-containing protein n=1 Tax=Trebonia kvetii TaxID=2480626 RepID=UPI001651E753|nr:lytic transglycosylase domain-containing protein [Trebonia kvetii]